MITGVDDAERLAAVETVVTSLERRLYGNGQPGDIAEIKSKLDQIRAWYWTAIGAAAMAAFLTPLAMQLVGYLVHGHSG